MQVTREVCLEVQFAIFFSRGRDNNFVGVLGRARISGLTCFPLNVKTPMTAYTGDQRGLPCSAICGFSHGRDNNFVGFLGRARVSGLTCFSYHVKKSVTAYIGDQRGLP